MPANRQDAEASGVREQLGCVQNLKQVDEKSIPGQAMQRVQSHAREHLGYVALELRHLALYVQGWAVLRLQPVGVTHLPCDTHAVECCQLEGLSRLQVDVEEGTCPSCAAPPPPPRRPRAGGRGPGSCRGSRSQGRRGAHAADARTHDAIMRDGASLAR